MLARQKMGSGSSGGVSSSRMRWLLAGFSLNRASRPLPLRSRVVPVIRQHSARVSCCSAV